MTFLLYLFTSLPAWFVGPLPTLDLPPDTPPVYFIAAGRPLEVPPDDVDRISIVIDPPSPRLRGSSRSLSR